MKLTRWILAILLAGLCASGFAAPYAVVEGVQMPAWLERSASLTPLLPGMALENTDLIRTGANARVLLRLAEGSDVKLGENAVLKLDNMNLGQGGKLFSGSLEVLKGAFRFTTKALSKLRVRREINVSIASVTAGIRGTDLWGKAADDKDIVCLIEGKITVNRGSDPQVVMQDPRSFYIAPKNAAPLPVAPVDAEQLRRWSLETEIAPGQGAVRKGGRWKVYVAQSKEQAEALAVYDRLREQGYGAEIHVTKGGAGIDYRVRIAGLPTQAAAQALAARLAQLGIEQPSASR